MSSHAPLIVVIGTVLSLLLVEKLLARLGKSAMGAATAGNQFCPGLSIHGLDMAAIGQIRRFILQAEAEQLALFLASQPPHFPELDAYLQQLRQYREGQPATMDRLQAAVAAGKLPKPPAAMSLACLADAELEGLLAFQGNACISRELLRRFGDRDFQRHFCEYHKHRKPVTLNIAADDDRREIMETLVTSGVAKHGRDIEISHRLALLSMKQLQAMARELRLKQKFTSRTQAIAGLAAIPGSRVLFSMQYEANNLFHLQPIAEDEEAIHRQWVYLLAHAKLLCSIPHKNFARQQ